MTLTIFEDDYTQPLRRGEFIAEMRVKQKLSKVHKLEIRQLFWDIKDYLQKIENKNLIVKIGE